jgi:hypothetical protein
MEIARELIERTKTLEVRIIASPSAPERRSYVVDASLPHILQCQ